MLLFALEVIKSVLEEFAFAKSCFLTFAKSNFLDLAIIDLLGLRNSDYLDLDKFVKIDKF